MIPPALCDKKSIEYQVGFNDGANDEWKNIMTRLTNEIMKKERERYATHYPDAIAKEDIKIRALNDFRQSLEAWRSGNMRKEMMKSALNWAEYMGEKPNE